MLIHVLPPPSPIRTNAYLRITVALEEAGFTVMADCLDCGHPGDLVAVDSTDYLARQLEGEQIAPVGAALVWSHGASEACSFFRWEDVRQVAEVGSSTGVDIRAIQ